MFAPAMYWVDSIRYPFKGYICYEFDITLEGFLRNSIKMADFYSIKTDL